MSLAITWLLLFFLVASGLGFNLVLKSLGQGEGIVRGKLDLEVVWNKYQGGRLECSARFALGILQLVDTSLISLSGSWNLKVPKEVQHLRASLPIVNDVCKPCWARHLAVSWLAAIHAAIPQPPARTQTQWVRPHGATEGRGVLAAQQLLISPCWEPIWVLASMCLHILCTDGCFPLLELKEHTDWCWKRGVQMKPATVSLPSSFPLLLP